MKRTQRLVGLAWFACLPTAFGTIGCASEVEETSSGEDAVAGSEVVSTSSEALAGGWATGPWTWSQSFTRPRQLASLAENVCVLTRLTGKFEGDGEQVKVTDDGTNWYLQGFSRQRDVAGEAYCFPRANFRSFDQKTRVSSEYALMNIGRRWGCGAFPQTDMYASDAFGFLSGLQGALHGGGEHGLVQQALSTDVLNYLEATSCTDSGLTVFARNFRAGAHTARLAWLLDSNGKAGDANDTDRMDFFAGGSTSSGMAIMAPTAKAMCAFTLIEGKFAGAGEWVQIRPEMQPDGVERWVLRTHRGADSDWVRAGARCFARDQTQLGPWAG